jgi:hypothetical protein
MSQQDATVAAHIRVEITDIDGSTTVLQASAASGYLVAVRAIAQLARLYHHEITATVGDLQRLATWAQAIGYVAANEPDPPAKTMLSTAHANTPSAGG